jgi:MFS transporter, SP family, arabinose:H+ symporter
MAVPAVLAGAGLMVLTWLPEIIVVMVARNAFVASFAIGVGGSGWLLQGEVFPVWQTGIGLGWIMICFAVTCLLIIAFIHPDLPAGGGGDRPGQPGGR